MTVVGWAGSAPGEIASDFLAGFSQLRNGENDVRARGDNHLERGVHRGSSGRGTIHEYTPQIIPTFSALSVVMTPAAITHPGMVMGIVPALVVFELAAVSSW